MAVVRHGAEPAPVRGDDFGVFDDLSSITMPKLRVAA